MKLAVVKAVIDLAADITHAGAVITHHKHPAVTGLVEIVSLGLALLDVLIRIALQFMKNSLPCLCLLIKNKNRIS